MHQIGAATHKLCHKLSVSAILSDVQCLKLFNLRLALPMGSKCHVLQQQPLSDQRGGVAVSSRRIKKESLLSSDRSTPNSMMVEKQCDISLIKQRPRSLCGILATVPWKRVLATSLHLLMIARFQTDLGRKIMPLPSHRMSKNGAQKSSRSDSSCTLRGPGETMVSLSTFSPQTAAITYLKDSFSLAADISAAPLNPLRNDLLCGLVD